MKTGATRQILEDKRGILGLYSRPPNTSPIHPTGAVAGCCHSKQAGFAVSARQALLQGIPG